MAHVQIKLGSTGLGSVVIDGHDVSNNVSGFRLQSRVGQPTWLELSFPAVHPEDVDVSALVRLSPETRQMLCELGWTPPAEDGA
jgi:hypothetical protein